MGWQHVKDGWIKVVQQKTGTIVDIPVHPDLLTVLEVLPQANMTFVVTSYGAPYTPAGFGNWFRERCNEAGLKHCASHGLRKAASRRLAEAGCSNQLIKSITGHTTDREVARYTADANQRVLAKQAHDRLLRAEHEQ